MLHILLTSNNIARQYSLQKKSILEFRSDNKKKKKCEHSMLS
jgi:hypothetical protein